MASSEFVPAEQYIALQEQNRALARVIAVLVDRFSGSALIHAAELDPKQVSYALEMTHDTEGNLELTARPGDWLVKPT